VHERLKTQLIAGALTLTTFNDAASTAKGPKQSSKAIKSFFMAVFCLQV